MQPKSLHSRTCTASGLYQRLLVIEVNAVMVNDNVSVKVNVVQLQVGAIMC